MAKRYEGGYACVFRLCVDDYHRYSYPADGEKSENIRISGILHTVNPVAVESVPVYHENTREYCLIETENFGTLLQMEVGAMMVGRIKNYHGPKQVKKGSEKGRFEFGGSTILLLVQKDRVDFREEFLKHTEQGIETQVEMGEWIGTAVCGIGYSEKDKKLKLVKKKYLTKENSSVMIAKVTRDGKICRTNSAL
ncbi:MAG: phosphatidylserine decarboxylase [Blautia sp.]